MNNLQGLRILIVDDERFMRSTIKAALRVVGCLDIAEAADGETALRLVGEYKPDLVLCDIGMEPMTGLQFVKRLRNHANPALREIPIVMVTAHADASTVLKAADLGIAGYLVKPISPKQLEDRLRAIFRHRQPD
jgi:two-component system chemotaxis response regulator CheY